MSDWKPGDIANGHVLGEDLVWRPVGSPSESNPPPPPSAPAPVPPPVGPSHHAEPPKKSNTVRNVIIGIILAMFLMCGGCFAFAGFSANEFGKEFDKAADDAARDLGVSEESEPDGGTNDSDAAATWTTVAELAGNTNKAGEDFHLKGCDTRLTYTLEGADPVLAAFYVVDSGKELTKDGGFPVASPSEAGEGDTVVRKSEGNYYIEVIAANVNWTAKVEEKC